MVEVRIGLLEIGREAWVEGIEGERPFLERRVLAKRVKEEKPERGRYAVITPNGSVNVSLTNSLNKAVGRKRVVAVYNGCLIVE